MWVKVAFFVCLRRAIFRGTRVVVGWGFGMGWEAFVCRHYLELLRNRWIGLSEGSCICEGLLGISPGIRMISDPFLTPSPLFPLSCAVLEPWDVSSSHCWKKICIVGFLLKVTKGLVAFVPDSLWVNSSEMGSWRSGRGGCCVP